MRGDESDNLAVAGVMQCVYVLFFLPLFTVSCAIVAFAADHVIGPEIYSVLAQFGLESVTAPLWQVGATIGFFGGMIRAAIK